MSLSWLTSSADDAFPPVEHALEDGLLAAGGDLSSKRLLNAYRHGIFPWFNQGDPILWWSPDPRMVLFTDQVKISKSLKKTLRTSAITISIDQAFTDVMIGCAQPRDANDGSVENSTWIHPSMIMAYTELYKQGFAHSIECWQGDTLIGGLYGIAIGQIFFGESMFSLEPDSSKIALVALCKQLNQNGFPLIDCQIHSDHLARMGASEITRTEFNRYLNDHCPVQTSNDCWHLTSKASDLL